MCLDVIGIPGNMIWILEIHHDYEDTQRCIRGKGDVISV